MGEVIRNVRQNIDKYEKRASILREAFHKKEIKHVEYPIKVLIEEIRENVDTVYQLILLLRLYGFSLEHEYLTTTTPLFYQPCPEFRYNVPTLFSEDEEEYRFSDNVSFLPRSTMIIESRGQRDQLNDGEVIIFHPGEERYHLEGGGRNVTIHASSVTIARCTTSYDLVLPLGVIAANLTTETRVKGVSRIGDGLVAWSPIRVEAIRGSLKIQVEWISIYHDFPIPLRTIPSMKVNYILLREIHRFLEIDSICSRIEAIMWRGINILDRRAIHQDFIERETIMKYAKEKCDIEALLVHSRYVRIAEEERKLWSEAEQRWRGS